MEAVGTIVKVVYEIVKAAETARQNRKRCLDLADRARTVGDILREDRDSATSRTAGGTALMRKPSLERLKAALDDALELVESQGRSGLGIPKLITSRRTAARFQDVETRITACVVDLGLAEQIAARRGDHRANAEPEAAPAQEAPRPQPQQGQDARSSLHGYPAQFGSPAEGLLKGYLAQSAQAQDALNAQYLMQANKAQGYLAQSAQGGMDAQSLMQGYLAQSAEGGKAAQSLMQGYLAQSAQGGKAAQALMQGYLAQSEQGGKTAQSSMQDYTPQSLMQGYQAQIEQGGSAMQSLLQAYLGQLAPQQQSMDVQSLLNGGYFGM